MNRTKTFKIALIAVMSALSVALYLFAKFSLPFLFPTFLDIQISDLPAFITTFMLGLPSGFTVLLIKILIKLPFTGTSFIGEFIDLIIGFSYILPAGIIYKKNKTFKGAFLSIILGTVSCIVTAMLINRFVAIPLYVKVIFDGNWNILLSMMSELFPNITRENFYNYYIWLSILPFNLLRCMIINILTLLLYKKLSRLFKYLVDKEPQNLSTTSNNNTGEKS
ncbi:MAG: ECF transporter S component [Christensenellales bacterium]|jgi:riboflavin transporter FmnP